MAKHKQKLKHVHCQGNPAGAKPGAIVAPSVDGAPILTLFEKAMDLVQGGADLQAAAVIGSDPSDTSETEQSNGLSFTAGTAKIKAIKFTSPSSIKVGGSDGSAYTWTVDATGHTLSGHLGGPSGAVAIILNLSGLFRVAPGGTLQPTITATLTDAFSHADGNLDNDIRISGIHVTAIDNNNKKATGAVTVHVVDDLPTLTVDAISAGALNSPNLNFNSLNLNVDETDAVAGSDLYAPGESQDDMNPDGNAGAAGLGQVTSNVVGGLASLFTIGGVAGADGATDSHALSFVFAGGATSLATTLSATDSGAIHLELSSSTSIAGVDGQGDTVFTIEIVETPASSGVFQLQLTLNEAIEHSDNARFDEVAYLLLSGQGAAVQLQLAVTRTDGDNDVVTVSDHIDLITNTDTFLTFDDDGPSAQAGTGIASAVLDESSCFPRW